MTLVRYQNQWPGLFDRFFNNDFEGWNRNNFSMTNTTLPNLNIKETKDSFLVEVAAPGFEKSDFKIELNNDLLTISSEKKVNNELKDGERITKQEFSYQSFSRSFTLPEHVDEEKISAKYENGILFIDIPKKEEAKPKPPKLISIK
ncbi:HSP20 family protein [Flavobacterium flevense]|uniref:Heat-shock protein n=1 Tax=Flavobacterium flevense TaxID=983 RepID=A0A4Y4AV29_9FLAO|nr:Hsp20/alpha crystallin family protein [Flavobacterium flevense]GEC72075.1 heat-shock protein [Flavobacterium flevense]SHL95290.1 HSP20 family protein [Flavobacterium flevense]